MKLNKKAQISIEALIILSILIISAVIFGMYYLNSIKPKNQEATEIEGDYMKSFNENINLKLSLVPDDYSEPDTVFEIRVLVSDAVNFTSGNIEKVTIKKKEINNNNFNLTNDCALEHNDNANNFTNIALDPIDDKDFTSKLFFICKSTGTYLFDFEIKLSSSNEITLRKEIKKTIKEK